jgi:hypothetical protein
MEISNVTKMLSGIILITVPSIEYGGTFLLTMLRTAEPSYINNPLRQNLFRAGHAHAGVLVLLSLICQLLADAAALPPVLVWFARLGAPCAAILMPLGFFLSVAGPQATKPSGLIKLVYAGALIMALAILVLGVGLIRASRDGIQT